MKYKLYAEVHVWGDRCVPRQRMEYLTCSVARPCVVNNGSLYTFVCHLKVAFSRLLACLDDLDKLTAIQDS